MKINASKFLIYLLCIIFIVGCDTTFPDEDDVATIEQIQSVLNNDLFIFNSPILPNHVYENLSQFKAIIIGEFHTILEEREFVASLTIRLNQLNGYTEVCAECPDAYSWIFESVSIGEVDQLPDDISYYKILPILDSIVTYNSNNNKSVRLRCIDANMQSIFFLNSIKAFAHYLSDSTDLLNVYTSLVESLSEDYKGYVNYYYNILLNSPNELGLSSTSEYTKRLIHMFEKELISIDIRE